jgi:hypothetical protein
MPRLIIDLEGLPDPYADDPSDFVNRVLRVAELLEQGYTSGYHPHWEIQMDD